jgi:hypothetical protein
MSEHSAHDKTDPGIDLDATQVLKVGPPADPLATQVLQTVPGPADTQVVKTVPAPGDTQVLKTAPAPGDTQVLKTVPAPGDTQPLKIGAPKAPEPGTTTTQNLKVERHLPEERPAPKRSSGTLLWVFGILAVAILGGSLAYYFLYPSDEPPPVVQVKEEIPPALAPYLEKAGQGDASAMRMLGTMYYNGLNVPRDRDQGIKWYRKAAAAGSVAARKDLDQLGLPVDEK